MRAPRLWRGTIRVDALRFDQPDATRRILAMWEPGASLLRCADGAWLLRFPKSRWLRAQEAPGETFVRIGAIWSSLRMTEKDAAQWPARSIVRARHGVAVAEPLPERTADPAQLIDVADFVLVPLAPLVIARAVARPAPLIAPPDTRELLEVGEAAEEARLFREKLVKPQSRAEGGRVATAVSGVFQALRGLLSRRGDSGRRSSELASPPREIPFLQHLRALTNRVILSTRLASVLGRKQAEYLSNLIDLLERQRFDEALRFAIPISGQVLSSLGQISLFNPKPRDDFSLGLSRVAGSGMMFGGPDLAHMLRTLYRRAAEQLEREGKIERAAFVLAELLDLSEEAVSLLERHGKLRLAARLAEARGLPPDLVVRQWLLAGDRARAIALARRHEVYETAIRRLEGSHRELADMLRVEWADLLAARGSFGAAAEALWLVEEARDRAQAWLDEAIARRGVAGARALARKLVWVADERPATLRTVADLLAEEELESAPARAMLVSTLRMTEGEVPAEVRTALRLGLRTRIRDAAEAGVLWKATDIETLARLGGDGALRADLPALRSERENWAEGKAVLSHAIDASDRGMSKVFDAVLLEEGILALALGEQGTVLLHPGGRTIARLPEPAFVLVISDQRDRALALAPRDQSYRVTRLDFIQRHAAYWRDIRLDRFAVTYDGATWFGSVDEALYAIDTTAEQLTSIWYNPDAGLVEDLVRTPSSVTFLNAKGELWQYDIPSYLLRMREPVEAGEQLAHYIVTPDGGLIEARPDGERTVVSTGRTKADRVIGIFEGSVVNMVTHGRWTGVVVMRDGDAHVMLLEAATGRVRVEVTFGASMPRLRFDAGHLLAFDHEGRVVAVDLERGGIVRDLRI